MRHALGPTESLAQRTALDLAGAWLLLLPGPAFLEDTQTRPPQELIPDFFFATGSALRVD